MDLDQASVFMAGSILIGIGLAAIGITIVFLNNIFSRYWKPVQWTVPGIESKRFMTEEELSTVEPKLKGKN